MTENNRPFFEYPKNQSFSQRSDLPAAILDSPLSSLLERAVSGAKLQQSASTVQAICEHTPVGKWLMFSVEPQANHRIAWKMVWCVDPASDDWSQRWCVSNGSSLSEKLEDWATAIREAAPLWPIPAIGSVEDKLAEICPSSRETSILIAMQEQQIETPESRKSQQKIIVLALGASTSANDHRRPFRKLEGLGLIVKGSNGRGYYLTDSGKQAATRLSALL